MDSSSLAREANEQQLNLYAGLEVVAAKGELLSKLSG